jgi:hypothetical protein
MGALMQVFVEGVGILGPGLPGWEASRGMLAGWQPYTATPTVLTASPLLPPAERRRCVPTVRLAMAVGAEAVAHAGRDLADVATVFTSSSGDPHTIHQILETLASDQRELSPTRFHNSVHNAPAGYWSIATRSREPSTSLSRDDESFQAGLLEAADIALSLTAAEPTRMAEPSLESLRVGNPAARSLPLLVTLARNATETIVLDFGPSGWITMSVGPPC